MEPELASLITQISTMRRASRDGREKPHKLAMLLAVLDLAEDVDFDNRIYFDDRLVRRFQAHLTAIGNETDWLQAGPPFFHLRSAAFWKHRVKAGREKHYASLTTSGGGSKRITENIEYAYLSSPAYEVFRNPHTRAILRKHLSGALASMSKIATTFHETIPFKRSALTELVAALHANGGDERLTVRDLHGGTKLGKNYVKAMRGYALGTGLLRDSGHVTEFGNLVLKRDPAMADRRTQWLLHYHLCAPHRPNPVFWGAAVLSCFRPGLELNRDQLAGIIRQASCESGGGELSERSIGSTAAIFSGTYGKAEALGSLGILQEAQRNVYVVGDWQEPVETVFAYVVADYWDGVWGERRTVNLDSVTAEQGGPASLLLLGTGQANRLLREMQSQGLVEIHRKSAPYTVVRLWDDTSELLEKVFE